MINIFSNCQTCYITMLKFLLLSFRTTEDNLGPTCYNSLVDY